MFKKISNKTLCYWLIAFAGIIFIAFQIDNTPRTDDEYLGEQVYWLQHTGKVKSDFGYNVINYNTYQSIFHKLFIYTGYCFSKLFGWSLVSLHAVSFCFFVIFILMFYKYCKNRFGNTCHFIFPAALLLLLFNQDLLYAAADFRPEVMMMTMGFASYILLEQYLKNKNIAAFVGAAILAGLCMFTHLNGLIFIVAGVLLLALKQQYKNVFFFGIIAAIAFLPYFADVLLNADFTYFKTQFAQDGILKEQHQHWYDPFMKLLNEQSRFLYSEKQIVLTAMLLLTLTVSYKKLKSQHKDLLLYTLILVLTMAITNPSKTTKYMVIYLPFLCLIIANGWNYLRENNSKKWLHTFQVLWMANIIISLIYSGKQIRQNIINIETGGIVAENQKILSGITQNKTAIHLLAPRNMVFYQLGKVKEIRDIEMVGKDNLVPLLQHSDISYVVFSKRDQAYFDVPALYKNENGFMELRDSTSEYKLFKINK